MKLRTRTKRRAEASTSLVDPRPAVPLAADELACAACGVAVIRPRDEEHLYALGRRRMQQGMLHVDERPVTVAVTRCPSCQLRRSRATAIMDAHPRVRVRLGGRSYVLTLVDAALAALEVIGVPARLVDTYVATDRGVRLLLDRLPAMGREILWSDRLSPVIEVDRDPASCAPARWAHVSELQAAELGAAYGEMLQRRIEMPQAYPPLSDGARGCLLCGVGTVLALPSLAQSVGVWSGPWTADPSSLGGATRPEAIHGYLCASCATAIEGVGALGPSALERALIAHLGVKPHSFGDVELSGFRAWAALPEGTPPNATPWAHEPGLDDFARELQKVI